MAADFDSIRKKIDPNKIGDEATREVAMEMLQLIDSLRADLQNFPAGTGKPAATKAAGGQAKTAAAAGKPKSPMSPAEFMELAKTDIKIKQELALAANNADFVNMAVKGSKTRGFAFSRGDLENFFVMKAGPRWDFNNWMDLA